jgi:hypothetical protein
MDVLLQVDPFLIAADDLLVFIRRIEIDGSAHVLIEETPIALAALGHSD